MGDVQTMFDNIPIVNTKLFRFSINNYIAKFGESNLTKKIINDRNRKYKEYIETADEFHLYEQKNMFCDIYFHESFEKVLLKVKKLINYYYSFEINNDIIEKLYDSLCNYDDENVIKNLLNNPINSQLMNIIDEEIKKAKTTSKVSIIKALDSEKYVLIHKTDNILEDNWNNNQKNISCSLITPNNWWQTWECGKYSLVFTVSKPAEIIAVGAKDLDAKVKGESLDDDFLTAEDLIKKTKHHNEVIITARYPSYVLCYDTVTKDILTASESLGIPILDLNSGLIISNPQNSRLK